MRDYTKNVIRFIPRAGCTGETTSAPLPALAGSIPNKIQTNILLAVRLLHRGAATLRETEVEVVESLALLQRYLRSQS